MTVITAAELLAADLGTPTAAELIEQGICDGACLVATGDVQQCQCACNGYYHGALAETVPLGWEARRP